MFKRVISIFLIVILLTGLFPLAVGAVSTPFHDVPRDAWFFEAVQHAAAFNIMQGTSRTSFSPNETFSRAMMVVTLYRIAGEPAVTHRPVFRDVPGGRWYSNAVIWAFDSGIITGTGPDTFAPHVNITREHLALMMHGYYLAEIARSNTSRRGPQWDSFTDRNQISQEAEGALIWANYNGLVNGRTATTIAPGSTATRAEAATIIMRFIQTFLPDKPRPTPPPGPTIIFPQLPSQPPDAAAFERELFERINTERVNHGLSPLEWNEQLAAVARNHSRDMAHNEFFGHLSSNGTTSVNRVNNAGIPYRFFSENLALGQRTPAIVVERLMNSPGHRSNILNPSMTQTGVGFYFGDTFVNSALPFFWTQKLIG